MKLFYRKTGETGKAVVILHGLFGSSDNWLTLAKTLGQDYCVYLLDLRNHGQSPHAEAFDYEVMAEDLHEFLTDHDIQNPVLVGHSMGGKVVMQYAMLYPQTFEKLVVVDIAPKFYPVHHHMILQGLNSINLETLNSRQEANDILARFEESDSVRQFLLKNLYRNTATGAFSWRINLPVLTRNIQIIGHELAHSQVVDVSILFVAGSESSYILPEDHRPIAELFTNVSFETIQGAGHWVQAEKPVEFLRVLRGFVEGI